MKRREIRERLDACQSDLHDLTEEEAQAVVSALEQDSTLKDEWRAIQAWDVEIRGVFCDVPVPSGLSERLSAAVAAHGTVSGDGSVPDVVAGPLPVPPAQAARQPWRSRATRFAVGILATSALLLIAAGSVFWRFGWGDQLTASQVADASRAWIAQLNREAWQKANPPLVEYPRDPSVRLDFVDWQRCAALTDSHAVAYRAELPPDHSTAVLFVIRTRQGRSLAGFPPTIPDSTTGDVCVGVWKNNGCLYVLVVRGNQSDYLRAVEQSLA
jgi:hypothetical protein